MNQPRQDRSINWWFICSAGGLAGAVFAIMTILAWIHGWEGKVALAFLSILGAAVLVQGLSRPVFHGFLTGFTAAFVAVELQALFLPLYFQNNPEYASIEIPFGLSARLATFLGGPVQGIVGGLVAAGIVWIFGLLGRLLNRS